MLVLKLFMLIVLVWLLLMAFLSYRGLAYFMEERRRRYVGKRIFLANALEGVFLLGGWFLFHEFSWLGYLMHVVVFLLAGQMLFVGIVYAAVLFRWIWRQFAVPSVPFDMSRRKFLKCAAAYPIAAAGAAGYGSFCEKDETVEREFQIPVKNLPAGLKGFRVAQLSDIHLGMFFSVEKLGDLLKKTAAGKPDMLVITGDLFDDVLMNQEAAMLLDSFVGSFPHGIWYCYGNHEHMRGIEKIRAMLKETRIHVLANEAAVAVEGKCPLVILGADYPMRRDRFQEDERAFMRETLRDVPKDSVKILLAHHPDFIDDAAAAGINLTLSGHTHGAQFGIFGMPLFPVFKYTRGMVRIGDSYGYVHSGNGSWFPCRIGCPPEIAYFTLRNG